MSDLLRKIPTFPARISEQLFVEECGGMCPTQATGTICGYPFYFRARHGEWTLDVVKVGVDPTGMYTCGDSVYLDSGEDETCGCVAPGDVIDYIQRAAVVIAEKQTEKKETK